MMKNKEEEKELPVMMYIHGFMSGANGAKQRQLQKRFKGRYRVIAPELDGDPDKSLATINELIKRERPRIIVGTSLGAWMALMCDSIVASLVLVNPVTAPLEELAHWLDESRTYFCKRLDGVQTYTLTRKVLDKYGKYSLKRAIAYRGGNAYLLCSTKDELLGDRHIRTLQPYFSPDRMMIVDDFGHQCRDAGLEHLFDILERVDRNFHIPYVRGQFAVLTEAQRAAAIRRSCLIDEVMEEEGMSPEAEAVVKEIKEAIEKREREEKEREEEKERKEKMTKEEFYEIARMRPEMPEKSVYNLIVYMRDVDVKYVRNDSGEWELPLVVSADALYSSLEEAERALSDYRQFISRVLEIHSARICRLPLDMEPGAEPIAWWLYGADGKRIDRSVCSHFHFGDKKTPAGKYLGRLPEEIRYKKGDIVEVIGFDSEANEYVATLAIVNSTPGTIEDEWRYFDSWQKDRGEYPFNGIYPSLGYFHDYTDDQYGYLTGCFGDNSLTEHIVAPSLPVADEIREELTQYQRNHAEWLKCVKNYRLSQAEEQMLLRGEITEEDIRTTRRMTEYLRQHPAKEIDREKKSNGKTECR